VRLGCWISQYYGPFLLGARFETLEPVYFLNFPIFCKLRQISDTDSADTEALLYKIGILYPECLKVVVVWMSDFSMLLNTG
jgi:hypothetical protein